MQPCDSEVSIKAYKRLCSYKIHINDVHSLCESRITHLHCAFFEYAFVLVEIHLIFQHVNSCDGAEELKNRF